MSTKQVYHDFFVRKFSNFCKRYCLYTPMNNVILNLIANDMMPEKKIAIDLFGKHGLQHTYDLAAICDYIDVYEIDPFYANYAKRFLPQANVITGNSIQAAKDKKLNRKDYTIVLTDNPHGPFGNNHYCEHFDVFPEILQQIDSPCTFILNLVNNPNKLNERDKFPTDFWNLWKKRRTEFYGSDMMSNGKISDFTKIYSDKFKVFGWETLNSFFIARHAFVGYMVFQVRKN